MLCVSHLKFRFQPVQITNFNAIKKIGNIRFICLKMLVIGIWIPVWMYAKQQGSMWDISV